MPRAGREQQRLSALREAEAAGPEAALPVVEAGLKDRSVAVVARAAGVAQRLGLRKAASALLAAAERVGALPGKSDPGCMSRIALVQALRHLEIDARDFFRAMLRVHQYDYTPAGFIEFIDIAAPLRAEAALAVAGSGDPLAPALLCDLLFETPPGENFEDTPEVRSAAARGLGSTGVEAAAYVLRAMLRGKPRENPDVVGECCCALAAIGPGWAEPLINEILARRSDAVPIAAIGIGESRCPLALPLLRGMWSRCGDVLEARPILIGFALTRSEEGFEFLLGQLSEGSPQTAERALEALKLYQRDESRWARVREVAGRLGLEGLP